MTPEHRWGQFELHALANVTPLKPIKILVDCPDHDRGEALVSYLQRRGYDAKEGPATPWSIPVEAKVWPDVVVLYEEESFGDTVGRAVALIGRSDAVRVIVATSRVDAPSAPRLRFVDEACSIDALAVEIERAWAELG
jgi:hypothetical protein